MHTLLHACASPNQEGNRTGGINRAFRHVYAVRRIGRSLKKRNRTLDYATKWAIFMAILAAIFVPGRTL